MKNIKNLKLLNTIGPLPKIETGYEYAITLICDITKYLKTINIANKSANTVAKAIFENFVLQYIYIIWHEHPKSGKA